MNVLLLTSSLHCGGVETHIRDLALALRARGHRVSVISHGGAVARELAAKGICHRCLPLHSRDPFRLFWAWLHLRRILRRGSFDLIHAHARIPAFLVSRLAERYRIPFVTTVHARFSVRWWQRGLSRWGLGSVAVSEDLKQYLCEEYGMAAEEIRVIPNGMDVSAYHAISAERQKRKGEALCLVFLSRLDRDCSAVAWLLCRMADRLKRVFPSLRIVLAGGGSELPALRREAERIRRRTGEDFISLPGYIRQPQTLLSSADVLIGVSRAALEAMLCGVSVILAGNEGFGGIAEEECLAQASRSNFCCRGEAPLTEENLFAAVSRLLGESFEQREKRGAALARYAAHWHSSAVMAEQTENFYRTMIQKNDRLHQKGTVVLCGYYGYGNMGDNALLRAACRRAEEAFPGETVCALTRNGKRDSGIFGVPCVCRTSLWQVRKTLRTGTTLVLGGGTLLQDDTSLRSLFYYYALLRYARRCGMEAELWGNGLSEPHSRLAECWMRKALWECRRVGVRDEMSFLLAMQWLSGRAAKVVRECDLAWSTPKASDVRIAYLLWRYGLQGKPFAVVALRGGIGNGLLRICLEWLAMLRAEGLQLLFVPMFPAEDRGVSRTWCRTWNGILGEGLSPSDLIGLMAHAQVVCGMRLHSLVFSTLAGTPFVGFGGDPKIMSFCHENGGLYFTELYKTLGASPAQK